MTTETTSALLDGNVETITALLPDMDLETLNAIRAAEEAGKTRKTLIAAIDTAIATLTPVPENAADFLARVGTDASLWADGFLAHRFSTEQIDHGLLIGWFANAIEAGREAGRAQAAAEPAVVEEPAKEEVETAPPPPDTPLELAFHQTDAHPLDHPVFIVFAHNGMRIGAIAEQALQPGWFSKSGASVLLDRDIAIMPDTPAVRVDHAVLVDDEGDVISWCEIAGGLAAGGGKRAEFPAGHLIFPIKAPTLAEAVAASGPAA